MCWRLRRIIPLALIATTLPLSLPTNAEARDCGKVRAEGRKYFVSGSDNVSCDFMRKWSKSVARGNGGPRGWDCNQGWRSGGCTRGAGFKRKFFTYRPPS
jgi:hypothetical protein